ncbi:hypothetical protein BABINDRAFT_162083 [Babjeviella inositovora NRRL Y-12698]|uniref:Uncharacterized protein n=1 Tax=Babjeviella inositovora NRRL Y-12698 TaxID=984486 RepID=A0A1E3QMU0_9ASCO|nr:uncharacterized protein BABINDRAFT_162083 [Babjeviella inositovora NRRL Y-12698]ODQ79009.1 hypothetical protein BABINDRAFT_162083 [Babjeviella inositovora NRRL Y-12698]
MINPRTELWDCRTLNYLQGHSILLSRKAFGMPKVSLEAVQRGPIPGGEGVLHVGSRYRSRAHKATF